jgi:broad specificity phosphatase PhoE
MKFLIIRHGDPDYKIDSLTEKGWREAELLADRLVKAGITSFYASPLQRAQHTAKPTLDRIEVLTGTRPKLEILEWLREFPASINLDLTEHGAPEGTPILNCPWNMPPQYWSNQSEFFTPNWSEHPLYNAPGCKVTEVYKRVTDGFAELAMRHGYARRTNSDGTPGYIYNRAEDINSKAVIALFCHLGLGNALLSAITGIPLPLFWKSFFLPTSSVTTVLMEEHPLYPNQPQARIIGLGDVSHLYAAGEPTSPSGLFCKID